MAEYKLKSTDKSDDELADKIPKKAQWCQIVEVTKEGREIIDCVLIDDSINDLWFEMERYKPKKKPDWELYFNPKTVLSYEKDQEVNLEYFSEEKMR